MRILHTGDLHIGKSVNNFSMIPDQKKILDEMVEIAREYGVSAFVIAGDVYDRSIPTAEAVMVMNDFLEKLRELNLDIFIISGNHDSPERLGFAQEILEKQSVHIAGTYKEHLKQVTLSDEYGEVIFTLMPFVKASVVGEETSENAVKKMLTDTFSQKEDDGKRHVLITHFFVTNGTHEPELSDSETTVLVGGLDNVDIRCFETFGYTALGHIHKPQRMDDEEDSATGPVVYAGSPLAYSFSECNQEKSVVIADMNQDGRVDLQRVKLHPLHQMRKIKGRLEELIKPEVAALADVNDYLQVTLTDEEELIDPMGTLRSVYPNVMQIVFEKKERERAEETELPASVERKTVQELFEDFYEQVRGQKMDEEHRQVIDQVVKEIS